MCGLRVVFRCVNDYGFVRTVLLLTCFRIPAIPEEAARRMSREIRIVRDGCHTHQTQHPRESMGTVRQRDSLVSERLAYVRWPSTVAVGPPTVRLARSCQAMACSCRRRSSWRRLNAGCARSEVIERRGSASTITSACFRPEPTCTNRHDSSDLTNRPLQMGDGDSWNFRIDSSSSFAVYIPTLHPFSHRSFAGAVKHDTDRRPHPRSIPITSRSRPLLPHRIRPHHPFADRMRRQETAGSRWLVEPVGRMGPSP